MAYRPCSSVSALSRVSAMVTATRASGAFVAESLTVPAIVPWALAARGTARSAAQPTSKTDVVLMRNAPKQEGGSALGPRRNGRLLALTGHVNIMVQSVRTAVKKGWEADVNAHDARCRPGGRCERDDRVALPPSAIPPQARDPGQGPAGDRAVAVHPERDRANPAHRPDPHRRSRRRGHHQ